MTRVVNCRKEPYDVYIGRPSIWGNPFSHLPGKGDVLVDSREDAIACYEEYLKGRSDLILLLPTLRDKTLGCWCSPKPCHGDVLVRMIDVEGT